MARQTVMTEKKLTKLIRQGYGSGRDANYRSWIRIRRKTTSTVSKLHTRQTPLHKRSLHLLSGLEDDAAHVGLWLQASEAREQFPLWPNTHRHPNSGLNEEFDRRLPPMCGLIDIAKQEGIEHGVYVGTNIPFVATLDFMWGIGQWTDRQLVGWSCKPRSLIDEPTLERMRERMHLEQIYCQVAGIKYLVIDGTQWPSSLSDELRAIQPLYTETADSTRRKRIEDFGAKFMLHCQHLTVGEAIERVGNEMLMSHLERHAHFRAATWFGYINADLRLPIVMSHRLNIDHTGYKERLRKSLFGIK